MIDAYITTKKQMTQAWNEDGKRIAVSVLKADPVVVTQVKTKEKDSYQAVKVGLGTQKESRINKPQLDYYKKKNLKNFPKWTRELKTESSNEHKIGDTVSADQVLKEGDVVNAQGITKGRGFTGGMKRWGFHGGPRTHGQSDRARAIGSIGQGTDPGRVHKGKKMPGHYGNATKTVTNLVVVKVDLENNEIWVSGPVPGHINAKVMLTKVGEKKKFVALKGIKEESKEEEKPIEVKEKVEVKKSEEKTQETPKDAPKEVKEDKKPEKTKENKEK
ncbi:50S ribosomal protein L3 [Patescibacteria group bacterium]